MYKARHEKTNILHMRKQRKIPLFPKLEISSLLPSSVAVQTGLCRARSETRTLVFS